AASVSSTVCRLSLDSAGAAPRERAHLVQCGHRRVAWERREQRSVGPAEPHRFFWRLSGEKAIKESGCEPVATADTVQHVQIASGAGVAVALHPSHGAPAMPGRGVYF